MHKILILMSLVLCSSAEKYTAGKNNHEQPCFDSATKASVEADAKTLHGEAKKLAENFNQLEGTTDSKYELYTTTCKEIEAKIISSLKLPHLPLCRNLKSPYNENVSHRVKFAGEYYDFMCNLKKPEYRGYADVIYKDAVESSQLCYGSIERTSSSGKIYLDFCGGKVPGLIECFKKMLVGEDDLLAFLSALIINWNKVLCVGEFNEIKYLWNLDQLASYYEKGSLVLTSMIKSN